MASCTAHWHDDIDDALAADFDGSLSGLGMELGTASFNMSDALMALPTLSSLKQETSRENGDTSQSGDSRPPSEDFHHHHHHSRVGGASLIMGGVGGASLGSGSGIFHHGKKNRLPLTNDDEITTGAIKRFCVSTEPIEQPPSGGSYYNNRIGGHFASSLSDTPHDHHNDEQNNNGRCRHSSSAPDLRMAVQQSSPTGSSMLSQMLNSSPPPHPPTMQNVMSIAIQDCFTALDNSHFQYVLGAATSIATKLHEETMTYLNQGQSYEIKLKKLGDLTEMRGKMLKSLVRVGFQERRLQYMEKEQIVAWSSQRVGERIVEIDVPLSYGVFDIVNDPATVNCSQFLWDPTKETGVFVRVNCISTEFTPKKHGGEKGVPFRIQIESYSHPTEGGATPTRLHVASCQVKVFKPKGADRKHKTDREKMLKRPQQEQDKYEPSYDCTVFTECAADSVYIGSVATTVTTTTSSSNSSGNFSPQNSISDSHATTPPNQTSPIPPPISAPPTTPPPPPVSPIKESKKVAHHKKLANIPSAKPIVDNNTSTTTTLETIAKCEFRPLSSEATSTEASNWLKQNRFEPFVKIFSNFCGGDILRLTRDDLIQICGLADGIRLYNALHSKTIRPLLTIYVCLSQEQVFRAIYLENLTVSELGSKLSRFIEGGGVGLTNRIYLQGPMGIKVLVCDQVVRNMAEDSMYNVQLLKEGANDVFRLLLKVYTP